MESQTEQVAVSGAATLDKNGERMDRRVLDGISVAALLAVAVFFLWLIR
jgi:hypothetical protein